jgi:exonuclease VII large subunit
VLERGFSVCWHVDGGRTIRSVGQVRAGDGIQVQVADGSFHAGVGRVVNPPASVEQ